MPYAANGKVSTEPFDGAIEITEEQSREAVDGMCNGMAVSIEGGVLSIAFPQPPEPPPVLPPTPQELLAAALAQRDALMVVATARMAPLQDAIDLEEATSAEKATMLAWKRYRVALNRIEQQASFPEHIDWPLSPDTQLPNGVKTGAK